MPPKPVKNALVVIAMKGFQDHELAGIMRGLAAGGFQTTICGKEKGTEAVGKFGSKQTPSIAIKDVKIEDYDRIAFVGGPGARALADEKDALDLAKGFYEAKKIVGAICIAPTILANSGILKGKRATVWDSKNGKGPEAAYLTERGVSFVPDSPVVVDLPFVTGNGPDAADEFGRVFAMV